MTDRTKYIDGIPVGLTDQDGTDSRFSVDVNVTSGSISSSGATEYTEGDVDASITGTAIMWEDTGDTLRAVSTTNSLPVNVTSGSITIEIGDIQIGAVEIKDHDSAARLDVEAVAAKNALFDQSEDGAHVTTGAIADVVVAAGATGTLSAKLRAISRDIDATNTAIALLAELTETQPVSVADGSDVTQGSLVDAPAARDAYEDTTARTQTALLKGIKNVLRDVVAAQLPDSHNVTIDNAGVGAAVNIQDGGNSITIDGTIAVSSGSVDVLSLPPDTFVAEGGALGKGVLLQGDDGTDRHNLQTDVSGYLKTIAQATEAHIGRVATPSKQVQVTPTITAGAYSIGDVIGGIQTLTAAARVNATCTTLDTLIIRDKAMQDADIKLWFFDQNPTSGSYYDNDVLDIDDADLAFCLGCLRVLSSDYDDASDNSIATLRNQGLKLTPTGGADDLYVVAEIETADSYASTSDLTFLYEFSQD